MEEQGEWQTLMGKSWEWMQIAKNGAKADQDGLALHQLLSLD